jgi:hypothetical protein
MGVKLAQPALDAGDHPKGKPVNQKRRPRRRRPANRTTRRLDGYNIARINRADTSIASFFWQKVAI